MTYLSMSKEEYDKCKQEILKNCETIKTKFGDFIVKKHILYK